MFCFVLSFVCFLPFFGSETEFRIRWIIGTGPVIEHFGNVISEFLDVRLWHRTTVDSKSFKVKDVGLVAREADNESAVSVPPEISGKWNWRIGHVGMGISFASDAINGTAFIALSRVECIDSHKRKLQPFAFLRHGGFPGNNDAVVGGSSDQQSLDYLSKRAEIPVNGRTVV